jgi:BirA family biotin operon repressor/biotin-[acetyl-CoA-carboxylase] ligase
MGRKGAEMRGQIIGLLRNKNDFMSGEEISRALGITRAGVWKKMKNLRQTGYSIEAVPSKGYKLLSGPDIPTKEEISAVFKGDIIGREIIFFKVTSSTNDRAMEIGQQGKGADGTVVIADAQERGRGRLGREWKSPPGVNLYFTVLLKPPLYPKEASVFTLMAAVAVVSAVREYLGLNAVIKWPNDILINSKKVSGILTEMKSDMDRINFVAVGIGVNVNMSLSSLPGDIRHIATSLKKEKGVSVNRVELLGKILSGFEYWYKAVLAGKKKALLKEWLRFDSTVGSKISVKIQDRVISGVAEAINDRGELVVRLSSGEIETVSAGEVTILKNK